MQITFEISANIIKDSRRNAKRIFHPSIRLDF